MIDGSQTGSSATVEELWNEFSMPLRSFLAARTRNGADAEDLLQDVFLRIHRSLPNLHHPEKLQGWVYRIARNAVVDHYRGRRDHEELKADPAPEPTDNKGAVDLTPSLRRFIAQLPPTYREPLEQHVFRGKGLAEVAKGLRISLTATKSRVLRARAMLRKMLDECCRFEFDHRGRVIEATPRAPCEYSDCSSKKATPSTRPKSTAKR
jgi:RNA polymerase sigma-70 factor (ECF subfamily)